jgi:hypothetical protein
MLAAQRILKSAIACSSRAVPGFAEGAVGRLFVSALPPNVLQNYFECPAAQH